MGSLLRGNILILLVLCLSCLPINGQSGPTITGVGYSSPDGITAAPLQVLTLTLTGVKVPVARVAAQKLPLPGSLEGFSATLRQRAAGLEKISVPILAVEPVRTACSVLVSEAGCGSYTALTVQIPGELVPNNPGAIGVPPNEADLVVSVDGVESRAVRLIPVSDSVHILNACDFTIGQKNSCGPLITHEDGSRVTVQSPVVSGEVVTMYAVGLGLTDPPVQAGIATPQHIPMITGIVRIEIEQYSPFESRPVLDVKEFNAAYAGLVQGYVGLYQINFRIPPIPPTIPVCDAARSANLLVRYKRSSESSAGICARPGPG